jgi:hypothetical protein
MTDYRDRLVAAVNSNAVVTVVGTGASVAMSRNSAAANWVGLIRTGIDRVGEIDPGSAKWVEFQLSGLELALETADTALLIGLASQVVAKLTAEGKQPYIDWLRDTVGSLRVRDAELARALGTLRTPLLTTNYDGLLEEVLRRPTVTWLDREGMREIFRSDSDAIGHLHGFWKSLESVVLTEADYSRVLSDEPSQALETAHYTSKSFLYVGYGDGLADPNFTHLLAWHRKLFPESRNDHFRLCRSADFDRLRTEHSRDDIRVIPYGDDYSDLPAFLSQLRPAEKSSKKNASLGRDAVAYAREAIVEQIRAETVIGDSVDNIDDRELSEITVRPVLLPMPHEQFVNARSMEGGVRPRGSIQTRCTSRTRS